MPRLEPAASTSVQLILQALVRTLPRWREWVVLKNVVPRVLASFAGVPAEAAIPLFYRANFTGPALAWCTYPSNRTISVTTSLWVASSAAADAAARKLATSVAASSQAMERELRRRIVSEFGGAATTADELRVDGVEPVGGASLGMFYLGVYSGKECTGDVVTAPWDMVALARPDRSPKASFPHAAPLRHPHGTPRMAGLR